MLHDVTTFKRIYIACGRTDLRKGIDGLSCLIKEQFHLDTVEKDVLFLFCGTRLDRLKGLVWEGDGFLLLYKRVDYGRFQWPRSSQEARELSLEQYKRLLEGLTPIEESTIHPGQAPTELL